LKIFPRQSVGGFEKPADRPEQVPGVLLFILWTFSPGVFPGENNI
jgi:hypothetical protein